MKLQFISIIILIIYEMNLMKIKNGIMGTSNSKPFNWERMIPKQVYPEG